MDLYKNKKVAIGYCAGVAEMTKEEFVQYLGMNGVSLFSFASDNEFLEELILIPAAVYKESVGFLRDLITAILL